MYRNVLTGTVLILACTFLAMSVVAEPPQYLNYQGRLTDDVGEPITNTSPGVVMTFTIWNDESLSDPGNVEWSAANVYVPVEEGLFEYQLGPLPANLFRDDADLWLGIKVDGDDELSPRTKLVSAAYACHAGTVDDIYVNESGDVMTGDLIFDGYNNGENDALIDISPNYANIELYDSQILTAKLWGWGFGELDLRNYGDGNIRVALLANTDGGTFGLADNTGSAVIALDAGSTGDDAVILPENAIHADEILNEPGVASTISYLFHTLDPGLEDIITVSITIPTAGYIFVEGRCMIRIEGETNGNHAFIQIDETPGGDLWVGYYTMAGFAHAPNTGQFNFPLYISRMYYKEAGTYTFRLEGESAPGGVGTIEARHVFMTATFYPTSYSSVKSLVQDPGDNPDYEIVNTLDPKAGTEKTMYEVDLRYYELKAKEARIKALEAEMEFRKAEQEAARGNR